MLEFIQIQNVVLIESLTLEFRNGYCALTGETGAGKSILLDSLGLALGARSESGLIRKGAEKANVSAQFVLPSGHLALNALDEQDIEYDNNTLVLRRTVAKDGRSKAFINDQPVSVSFLKTVGQSLVEIHGQFETHGLLDPKTHQVLLDSYAGIHKKQLKQAWDDWKSAQDELHDVQKRMNEARDEEDYLRQSLEDLDALSPQHGEEEKLVGLKQRLLNRDQVLEALNQCYAILSHDSGTEDSLGQAYRVLEKSADKIGQGIDPILEALDRASSEVQEAVTTLQSLSTDMEESEYNLQDIDDRLHNLRNQARKHKCQVDDLQSVRDQIAQDLSNIENQDERLAELIKKAEAKKSVFVKHASQAREQRQKSALQLDKAVMKELAPLKLDKARFYTSIEELDEERWTSLGMDSVTFLVSTNPGRDPGPLNKIASGGEMARFMLALKVVLAENGGPLTLVFDEVDTGIGGSTAAAVGERLSRLSKNKQILVVTHSPQVAASADHHFIVMKGGDDEVRTGVISLNQHDDRREEIARMLSGEAITDESRAAADKLLETGT